MGNTQNGQNQLDFSEAAAQKAAFSETLQHPLTIWPPAFGILSAFAAGLFTAASAPLLGLVAVGGIGIGAANWACRYLGGKEAYMQKHYDLLHQQFEKLKKDKSGSLVKDLRKQGCAQGSEQVAQFETKFTNLREVLERVLSPTELTFSRYLSAAELVYTSGIENLERIITITTTIADIDREELEGKIVKLEARTDRGEAGGRTLKALQDRAKLYDDGEAEIAELLSRNEEALTAIDATGVAVGKITSSNGNTSGNLELAMGDLINLIARVNNRAKVRPLDEAA